jgi:hypothetical protein
LIIIGNGVEYSQEGTKMNATIEIKTDADWQKIRAEKLNVVVDPMVFRTADVFLRGAKGMGQSRELKHPATMWSAISSNIGSLCTFFDALILEKRLPMYDYAMTFPPDIETGRHTLIETCNADEEVLVSVSVQYEAYRQIKQAAVAVLHELPEIPETLAADIHNELSAFDWEWRPDLWRDENVEDSRQRVLDAFKFGGILFSGYAQRTGADHILQPKRARLYLAASLGSERADDEKALFAELTRLSNEAPLGTQRTGDLPAMPTFLPYLLKSDDQTPQDLLKRALKFRRTGIVDEYREWRKEVIDDIEKGRVPTKLRKEIARIAAAIARELKVESEDETKISAKVGAKVAAVGPLPVPEVSGEVGLEKQWNLSETLGWFLRNIPGYRYRKLLMRLVIAQREYTHIDRHLYKIWNSTP